jgi:Spy/CpxP family protein refolding chaperone
MPAPAIAPRMPSDPIMGNLYPPELIMAHAEEIGLKPEQKSAIKDEVRKAQAQFTEMHWALDDAVEALTALLKTNVVDEQAVMGQLDKVLDLERAVKRAQMGLMIRLKNKLTPNQQYQLGYLERMQAGMPAPPMPPPQKEPTIE